MSFNPAYNCQLNRWSHLEFLQIAMFSARTRRRIARSSWNKPPSGHSRDWGRIRCARRRAIGRWKYALGQFDRTRWRYRVRSIVPGFYLFYTRLVVSNIFSIIYGMSSFPLTFIFFKMVKTTNQIPFGETWQWNIFHTRWCPPVISWFINPINYRYIYHKP